MFRLVLVAAVVLVTAGPHVLLCQELAPSKITHSDIFASAIGVPAKCDLNGNLLVRVHQEEIGRGSAIVKVGPDGKSLLTIRLNEIPEYKDFRVLDFAAGRLDDVFVLANAKEQEPHVLRFDGDAKLQSDNTLVPDSLRPTQMGSFPSSDMLLISGFKIVAGSLKPMVGIIGPGGDEFREIAVELSGPNAEQKTAAIRDAIAASAIEPSDNGRLWLMRFSPIGPVYSVTASGVIDKRIRLKPPQHSYLSQIKVSHGKLVATFIRNKSDSNQIDRVILHVIDIATGRIEGKFWHTQSNFGSVLACAEPGSFTFVSTDENGKLQIIQTAP